MTKEEVKKNVECRISQYQKGLITLEELAEFLSLLSEIEKLLTIEESMK